MSCRSGRLIAIAMALALIAAVAAERSSGATSDLRPAVVIPAAAVTPMSSAAPAVRVALGASRPFSSEFFGYNLGFAASQVANVSDLLASDHDFTTGTLRYPGGTLANYWNWRTSSFNAAGRARFPELNALVGSSFGLPQFAAMLRSTNATAVLQLNVMTSTLNEQIAMLKEAVRLGIDVRYIELGNELYLPIDDYRHAFPFGTDYATLMQKWAPAIHAVVPNARLALAAAATDGPQRSVPWNPSVFTAAKSSAVSAVTLHLYPKPTVANANPNTIAKRSSLFAQAYDTTAAVQKLGASLPTGKSIWVTEANLLDLRGQWGPFGPEHGTWTHALFVSQLLLLLSSNPKVTLVDVHALFGQAEISSYATTSTGLHLTAMGATVNALTSAAAGATSATSLVFTNGPTVRVGTSALVGARFTHGTTAKTVLLNLGSTAVPLRNADLHAPASVATTQFNLNPATVPAEQSLVPHTGIANGTVELPPYSLTIVG